MTVLSRLLSSASLRLASRRVALLLVTLLLVSVITFGIMQVLPGNIINALLGDTATPDQIAALQHRMGFDTPLPVRYWNWISRVLQGDLGISQQYGIPVSSMLSGRVFNSLVLGLLALVVSVPLALALGTLGALHRGRRLDRFITALVLVNFGLPEYVLGVLAILVFSVWFPLLPGSSLVAPGENPLARPLAMVLPVLVLSAGLLTYISQITRTGMIRALQSPYVRTAVLKGLPMRVVVLRHALPNVMLPVLAEIGMHFGYVIGGLVVVETLFSYAGVGQMLMNAVTYRDVVALQGTVLVIAAAYGVGNMAADLIALRFDPRIEDGAAR